MGQQLALGPENILPAAQTLDVGVANIRDDPHIGLDDTGQIVDLAKFVHPHLQHRDLMAGVQLQQGQRQTYVVIVVALRLEHLVSDAQNGGQHILGGGLAHAAGHADQRDCKPVFMPNGQVPEGLLGVLHLHIELSRQAAVPLQGGDAAGGAPLQGGVHIGVAVEAFPHQREEQGAGMDGPAVRLYLGDGSIQPVKASQQAAVYRLQQLSQGDGFHYSLSFRASMEI